MDYQTPGLIGGYYNGATNTTIASAGNFTMSKTATGQYTLTVPGESPTTGMLIMSVANEVTSGAVTAPDDNILTYATGTGNSFTINSYDLPAAGFQDTKFVWAFISFANPIAPYVIPATTTATPWWMISTTRCGVPSLVNRVGGCRPMATGTAWLIRPIMCCGEKIRRAAPVRAPRRQSPNPLERRSFWCCRCWRLQFGAFRG